MAIYENNGTETPWKKGDAITADRLNEGVESRNRRHTRPPQQVIPERSGGSGEAIACTIVSIHRNHLVCTKKTGGTINVARPLAARSPASELIFGVTWNYTSYSTDYQHRTATHSQVAALTEAQVVLREYKVGDTIRATRVAGGTDVTDVTANAPEAPEYEEVHPDRTWYRNVATP